MSGAVQEKFNKRYTDRWRMLNSAQQASVQAMNCTQQISITCRLRSFALSAYILVSDVNLLDISLTSAHNVNLLLITQPTLCNAMKKWKQVGTTRKRHFKMQ